MRVGSYGCILILMKTVLNNKKPAVIKAWMAKLIAVGVECRLHVVQTDGREKHIIGLELSDDLAGRWVAANSICAGLSGDAAVTARLNAMVAP